VARKRGETKKDLGGTKATIIEAALNTVRSVGYAGASARAIARTGGFNQALIFYHFGTVDRLLLAALDYTSAARMNRYREAVQNARTVHDLIQVAREGYRDDLDGGHMTVVAELVAGGVADPMLRPEIASRMRDWVDFVEGIVARFLEHSPMSGFIPTRDAASAVVAFYLGLNISARLGEDQVWIENLFNCADAAAPLLTAIAGGP
jgi:AcrR family transcriptional regulator